MNLKERIGLMVELGNYLKAGNEEWNQAKTDAFIHNGWFTESFIDLAVANITKHFLDADKLNQWVEHYHLDNNVVQKNVGIVMAGNIPLVGFHDFLAVFISGHHQTVKLSSKDSVLFKKIVEVLTRMNTGVMKLVSFSERLNECDAYITTGSNNTSRYFEYYFGKYPSIIRKNKTSVAILDGNESLSALENLADDMCLYFGLGCRNVTKIFVPKNYNFENLLNSFSAFSYFRDHKKYRNNFDYYLTLQIMNGKYYMTNQVILLLENSSLFSPISQASYSFYENRDELEEQLEQDTDIQCISGTGDILFGTTQQPGLFDYADKTDTMAFLLSI